MAKSYFSVFPETMLLDSRTHQRWEFGLELILNSNDQILFNTLLQGCKGGREKDKTSLGSLLASSSKAGLPNFLSGAG